MTRASASLSRSNQVFDVFCALSVMLLTFAFVNIGRMPGGIEEFLAVRMTMRNLAFGVVLMVIWRYCFAWCGLYDLNPRTFRARQTDGLRIVAASTIATGLVLSVTAAAGSNKFNLPVLGYFWIAAIGVELTGRFLISIAHRQAIVVKQAVIVGSGARAQRLYQALRSPDVHGCEVIGFVDSLQGRDVPDEVRTRLLGPLEEFESLLSTRAIDQVLIALPVKSCYDAIQRAIDICERVGVEAMYFPDMFSIASARREHASQAGMPVVRLQRVADDYRLTVKRVMDIVGAAGGMVVLSPLLLLCAIAVKLSGPGPVFFSQVRYGFNRRMFRMYKFRTMVQDAEQLQGTLEDQNEARGPIFKIRRDPRITSVGRILRKLSLDELPQLFNVLRGEMSLVGPRPMSIRDVSRFSESWLLRRFSVRPGLTCLWQVNGRSNTDFARWVELDLAYIDNWSLTLDMRILIKTVPAVISGSGAM